jgi:hypothetical protein
MARFTYHATPGPIILCSPLTGASNHDLYHPLIVICGDDAGSEQPVSFEVLRMTPIKPKAIFSGWTALEVLSPLHFGP